LFLCLYGYREAKYGDENGYSFEHYNLLIMNIRYKQALQMFAAGLI